jgi:PKD repeat protein
MNVLRKGIIFTVCLMLLFFMFGDKGKKDENRGLTLDEMRTEIAKRGLNFTVGESEVMDIPLDNLCGLVEPPNWRDTGKFDGGVRTEATLPSSFDWRDSGVVTDIQNQGSCGSCWAFGTIGSYESCVAVAGGGLDDLSEEWLLDCNSYGYDCGGGWWAFGDLTGGAPLESCYPYVGSVSTCYTGCPKYHPMDDWYYVGPSSGVASTTDIKNAMYEHGPVCAAIYVDSYFQGYDGGIFSNTSSSQPNHGIVLVGWNDSGGYWILKNSWGTSWGESGYMRIEYGANNVGYAAAYGLPENVTPQPPVADFSGDPTTVEAGNTVQFTDLSTNSPTSWSWTFEGGTPSTSTAKNPVVTYNTVGNYDVTLTATNAVGSDSETKTNYITVLDAVYCDSSASNQGYEYIAGVDVSDLSNTSGASGYSDFTYMTANLVAGESADVLLTPGFTGSSYSEYWKIWIDYNMDSDFEDSGEEVFSGSGSSTVSGSFTVPTGTAGVITRMRVSMQYNSYPPYCGTFTYGEVEDYTVEISEGVVNPPVADFTASDTTIYVGDNVTFTDLSTNSPTSWSWTFNGGTPSGSTQQNPTITYNTAGTYTVSLTATNSAGSDTETKTNYITVEEIPVNPPVSAFSASTTTINIGGSVTFTDQSTNNPTAWSWTFEGGTPSTSSQQNPTITYNTAGIYDVSLTVTNSAGSDTETKTDYITVTETLPTVGYDEIFSSTSTSANRRAMPFTMPENGSIQSVTIYHAGGSGGLILGVYDGEGSPQNRLGVTPSTTINSSAGWQTIDLNSPAYVAGGSTVWLAWVFQSNPGIRYETGSPGRYQSTQTWSGGMPDPFGSGSQTSYIYSIYATYVPEGGPTTKKVGYTTAFGSTSTSAYRRALPFTMPEDGTIESVTMYHSSGNGDMILAVYDGEGTPQNRLARTAETAVNSSTGWQTINLTSPVSIQGGSTIWLAWVYENNPGIRYQTGSPGRYQSSQTWSGGMPDPFGSGSQTNYIYSIYATYTVD